MQEIFVQILRTKIILQQKNYVNMSGSIHSFDVRSVTEVH